MVQVINPERQARKKLCIELGITNGRFRKINKRPNRKYDYDHRAKEYKRIN